MGLPVLRNFYFVFLFFGFFGFFYFAEIKGNMSVKLEPTIMACCTYYFTKKSFH